MAYLLKIEAGAGASGDMFISAFYALLEELAKTNKFNVDIAAIDKQLRLLLNAVSPDISLKVSKVDRNGIFGTNFLISSNHHHHSHHVTYPKLINFLKALLDDKIIDESHAVCSEKILKIIAEAEAVAHNVVLEKVHFHEIGEEDSIYDIVANGFLINTILSLFDPDSIKIVSSTVEIGKGEVDTSHGRLAIPAPATKNIIEKQGIQFSTNFIGECLTPTGAAVLSSLEPEYLSLLDEVDAGIIASGIGCGYRNPSDRSNILKISLLET